MPTSPGAMLSIRPLAAPDHDRLLDLYLEAPVEDRCTRFCARVNDDYVVGHVERALARADLLLGAFEGDALVGAAELFIGDGCAELAFLVARPVQQRGIGKALMKAALAASTRLGARKAMIVTAPDNRAMHRLALTSGMKRKRSLEGDWMAEIDLPLPPADVRPGVTQVAAPVASPLAAAA